MSAAKHTLGPWIAAGRTIRTGAIRGESIGNPGVIPCDIADMRIWDGASAAEQDANTRLIAATPELLTALRELANEVTGITSWAEPLLRTAIGNTNYAALVVKAQIARRAIAKAEGRS